ASEVGAVYAVQVVRAGGNLTSDHLAGSEYLSVEYGWDFEPGGGSLTLNGYSYEYTSATYPDPDDEDDEQPTILNLAVPTDAETLEGDFGAIEPERSETVALVELAGFDEAVTALVPHTLQPMLTTGIRGDAVE